MAKAPIKFTKSAEPPPPAQDEAPCNIQVQWKPGHVAMVFDRDIKWLGFTPDQAMTIGRELMEMGALASRKH